MVRQFGHADRLLPLRVVSDRNRGWGMVALIVNAFSTFGMMLILTYQLQSVMGYSALKTGLALVPFALGAALGSAFVAPRLMRRIPPRWLITAAVVVEAAGLVPLIWLTPHSGYLPLVLVATVVEGIGTGLAGPTTLNTALRGVLPADAGAAGAATSAAGSAGLVGGRRPVQHHRRHRHRRLPRRPSGHERPRRPGARLQRGHGLGRARSPGRGDPDRAVRERPSPGGEAQMSCS